MTSGVLLGGVLGIVAGIGIATWWFGPDAEHAGDGTAAVERHAAAEPAVDADAEIARLRAALARERAVRARLAEQIAAPTHTAEDVGGHAEEEGSEAVPPADAGPPEPPGDPNWFDDSRLAALGMRSDEIEAIRVRWEQSVLDRLYITDRHAREGGDAARNHDVQLELMEIQRALREDLGEVGFDALLYATDRNNRVRFTGVIEDSPGAEAGLQANDEVISYAGQRVHAPIELKQLTQVGRAGEWVEMEVMRGDERVRIFVRRGPLGVQLQPVKRPPISD